ncbi:hypothetical protein IV500_12040 [Paeniglutamicibacter antarcticus]|uniref:Uncharacterized protein n=1 Tax=Arthrobacter terrae TaxID=2935737 RepID=A0A931G5Z9_9MICC|nr:hypothetical protein [Arthrobacter terrae]MBG0740110.1 hypothetical protein [Arthrobacter terrae]
MSAVSAPFRWLRSGTIAVTILALAAGAHTLAGGVLPEPILLLALTALTAVVSVAVTSIRVPLALMLALLGASQLLLHNAFDLLSNPMVPTAALVDPAMAHHLMGVHTALAPQATAMAQMSMQPGYPSAALAMTLAHVGATLATAVVLAKGEEALWLLADWLRPLVRLAGPAPVAVAPFQALTAANSPIRPQPWRNLRADCRRGPPTVAHVFV